MVYVKITGKLKSPSCYCKMSPNNNKLPMITWGQFTDYINVHWKIFLGVGIAIIVVIIVVSLVLTLVVNKSPSPTTSFKGPSDINGDPPKPGDLFSHPQIITNPNSNSNAVFGKAMFVHQAGYICVVSAQQLIDGYQYLNFYTTDIHGNIKGPTNTIVLDFLPINYVVCNGAFAPIFNIANEVYYLFVSVGVVDASGNMYATNILLYTFNTNPNAPNALKWIQGNIQSTYAAKIGSVSTLKIPFADSYFKWNSNTPYYGTFGDKIQVVLDDNEAVVKQSLYINGSENNPNFPGGNLYWFVLSDNSTSPSIIKIKVIQDAKLLLLKQQREAGFITCPQPTVNVPGDYINGFASDFFVSSGSGKSNVMLIANCTNQDYCALKDVDQPAAPKGYVQGYIPDTTNGWIQPQSSLGSGFFFYRYIGALSDTNIPNNGFGYSVGWIDSHLVVGLASSPNSAPPKNAQFFVYEWLQQPFSNGQLIRLGTIPTDPNHPLFLQTDLYPISVSTLRFNLFGQELNDDNLIMITTWYDQKGDVISIQDPIVPKEQPDSKFSPIQNIGNDFSSQASIDLTRCGFGQYTNTWLSRTGKTVRMAINDPFFLDSTSSYYQGRIIILTKSRTS